MKSNIWKLQVIKGLRGFTLTVPVIVVLFRENGLSVQDVFVLQGWFALVVVLLEVPSGYFADVFGKKSAIVIGTWSSCLGFLVYAISGGFWMFALAETILGIGCGFMSGSDSAMLYDTLAELGTSEAYRRRESANHGFGMFFESIASVLGGILAAVSLYVPLYADAAVGFVSVLVARSLVEPSIILSSKSMKWQLAIVEVSGTLFRNALIRWLSIYAAVVQSSTLILFWLIQPYLMAMHIPIELFGIILACLMMVGAVSSWCVSAAEKFLGMRLLLVGFVVFPGIGYWGLGFVHETWAGAFLILFYIVRGWVNPVILDLMNRRIGSELRATVLSMSSLLVRASFVMLGPVVGFVHDTTSLHTALLFSGGIFLVLGFAALGALQKSGLFSET